MLALRFKLKPEKTVFKKIALLMLLVGAANGEISNHNDWLVECKGANNCLAVTQGDGIVTLIGRAATDNSLRIIFRVDPNATVDGAATLRFNNGWQAPLQVTHCTEEFCEVIVHPDGVNQVIKAMKPVREGHLAYSLNGNQIAIGQFSLMGLSAALAKL